MNWCGSVQVLLVIILVIVSALHFFKKLDHSRNYYEPVYAVVGGGINRQLNNVEAAITLNRPITQVVSIIFLRLLSRGVVEIRSYDHPVKLLKKANRSELRYETAFLQAINTDGTLYTHGLADGFILAVKDTVEKQAGCDIEATKGYYEDLCRRSWEAAEGFGSSFSLDTGSGAGPEWMLIDEGYMSRMDDIVTTWPMEMVTSAAPGTYGKTVRVACESIHRTVNNNHKYFWKQTVNTPPSEWDKSLDYYEED